MWPKAAPAKHGPGHKVWSTLPSVEHHDHHAPGLKERADCLVTTASPTRGLCLGHLPTAAVCPWPVTAMDHRHTWSSAAPAIRPGILGRPPAARTVMAGEA